jgi:ribose transport system substrate-binding protein
MITPSGSREIVPAIAKANAANIPVVTIDTRVDEATMKAANAHVATFIGSDNLQGGQLAGEFLAQKLGGQGKVAVLEGIPGHETGDSRLKGFREMIAQEPENVDRCFTDCELGERPGFNVMQNILQSHSTSAEYSRAMI